MTAKKEVKPTHFYLSAELHKAIKIEAATQGLSMSEFVETACWSMIAQYLGKSKKGKTK